MDIETLKELREIIRRDISSNDSIDDLSQGYEDGLRGVSLLIITLIAREKMKQKESRKRKDKVYKKEKNGTNRK